MLNCKRFTEANQSVFPFCSISLVRLGRSGRLIQMWVVRGKLGLEYPLSLISTLWNNPNHWLKPWAGTPHWSPVPIMATTSSEEIKEPKTTFLKNSVAENMKQHGTEILKLSHK